MLQMLVYANNAIHGGALVTQHQLNLWREWRPALSISLNTAFLSDLAAHNSTYLASYDYVMSPGLCV